MSKTVRRFAAGVMATIAVAVGPAVAPAIANASGSALPWGTDPDQNGYIALCDLAGNNVTSGNINSAPFVWKAVSSVVPPKEYQGPGEVAGLDIFQPRPGVDPGDWNGDSLSASTFYHDKQYPAAEMTYKDFSLKDFIHEFPPLLDGLYQLRMEFGKINYARYQTPYPATTIQVTGDTWHVVQGGTLPCGRASAISGETFTGIKLKNPVSTAGETPPTAAATDRAPASDDPPSSSVTPAPGATTAPVDGHVISAPLSGSTSSNTGVIVLAVAGGAVLLALGGGVLWGRRKGAKG